MKQVIWQGRRTGKSVFVREIMAERIRRIYTLEQYLDQLVRSDRGPGMDEQWMTLKLQQQWPGPYHVEKVIDYQWQSIEYKIVFDTPEDETWFRLKY